MAQLRDYKKDWKVEDIKKQLGIAIDWFKEIKDIASGTRQKPLAVGVVEVANDFGPLTFNEKKMSINHTINEMNVRLNKIRSHISSFGDTAKARKTIEACGYDFDIIINDLNNFENYAMNILSANYKVADDSGLQSIAEYVDLNIPELGLYRY